MQATFLSQRPVISKEKFERSNPEHLFQALFYVLARYQREGKEPGAERWQADTRWSRPALVNDIRQEWMAIVGGDYIFPWHEDYVIDCFVSLRKAQKHLKVALCHWYDMDVPDEWKFSNEEEKESVS